MQAFLLILTALVLLSAASPALACDEDPIYELFQELNRDALSAERRTELLNALVDEVGGFDDSRILYVLGKQMEKDALAREVVLPRFAELIRWAREDKKRRYSIDKRLCQLINAPLSAREAPPTVVTEVQAVLKASKDFRCAAPKAAAFLLSVDPSRRDARQWLTEKLQCKDRHERMKAAAAIGAAAKRVALMAPQLQPLLKDEAVEVRVMAAWSLWRIDPGSPNVISVLRQSLTEEAMGVRLQPWTFSEWAPNHKIIAVDCFRAMGPDAREAAGDVARLLKDDDQALRWSAARALETMGVPTPDVLRALEAARADSNVAVAQASERALKALTAVKPPPKL